MKQLLITTLATLALVACSKETSHHSHVHAHRIDHLMRV